MNLAAALLLACSLQALDRDARRVYESAHASVVQLLNDEGSGSGMVLDAEGTVLTNAHVVVSPLPFRIDADLGGRRVSFMQVRLLGVHPRYDLALVRIEAHADRDRIPPVRLAPSGALTGDRVFALGFPLGGPKRLLAGVVTGVDQVADQGGYTEFDAPVEPGNSGGPVLDLEGRVVGVTTFKAVDRKGRHTGMMLPVERIRREDFVPLDRRPANPSGAAEFLRLGEELLKHSQRGSRIAPPLALRAFQMAVFEDSTNPETYHRIGMFQNYLGLTRHACAYLFRSLQLRPWCDGKGMVYQELAAALIEQRRPTEAADILWEGLSKYPKEAPALWDTLAVLCHAEGAWPQAAVASRCSLLTFAERPERMNAIYRESRERMKPEELKKLIEVEPGIEPALQRAQATASKARAEGRPFLIAETAELVRSFSGVQRLDVAATSRPVAARAPLFSWDSPAAPAPEPAAAAAASGPGDPEDAVFIRSRTAVAGEHYLSGRKDKAKAILEDLVRTFPGHPETRTAKDLLAKMKP